LPGLSSAPPPNTGAHPDRTTPRRASRQSNYSPRPACGWLYPHEARRHPPTASCQNATAGACTPGGACGPARPYRYSDFTAPQVEPRVWTGVASVQPNVVPH